MSKTDPTRRRPHLTAAAAFMVVLVISTTVAVVAFGEAQRRAEEHFSEASTQTSNAIESTLRNDLDELRDAGAFISSGSPSSGAFSAYVDKAQVLNEFDAIVGLLVLERVEEADVDEFLADKRRSYPDFTLTSLGERPAGHPYYILTHYVSGRLGIELPLGVDVSALIIVQHDIEPKSWTGSAVAGAIQNEPLIQEVAHELGETEYGELFRQFDFLMAVPAFADAEGPEAGEPATIWVAAPVGSLDDLLARSLQDQPNEIGVKLTVEIDNPALAELDLGNVAERANPAGSPESATFHNRTSFEIDGLRWSISMWSSPEAGTPARQLLAVLLGLGLVVSAASAAAVYLRTRGILRDAAYRQLRDRHERARLQRDVLASVHEAVVVLDEEARVIVGNPSWNTFCARASSRGITVESLRYVEVLSSLTDHNIEPVHEQIEAVLHGTETSPTEVMIRDEDEVRWFEIVATPLDGPSRGAVIVHRDVTGVRQAKHELQRQADHDPLTGLLNRSAMEREALRLVNRARDDQQRIGALFIDLDDFKLINDTYGHAAGDVVLRAVAGRIRQCLRDTDLVSRHGGDEFLAVLYPVSDRRSADQLAERLLDVIRQPIAAPGQTFHINCSIGVVVLENQELSLDQLVSLSDQAMYEAKTSGGASYADSV